MRKPIDKRIIWVLCVALLSFIPSNHHASKNLADGHDVSNIPAASEGLQLVKSSEQLTEILTRWDIYEIIFGTLLALFGFKRFREFIKSNTALPAGQFADALIQQLFRWSGKPSGEALDDDLTLIVADYQHV